MRCLFLVAVFVICYSYASSQACVDEVPNCSRIFCRFYTNIARKCQRTCRKCAGGPTTPAPTPGPWSRCSRSCGRGTRTRTRACPAPNPNNCPRQTQPCNTERCPLVFDSWTACSRSCDTGTRFRVRRCRANNINTCPREFQDCNTRRCPNVRCPRPSMPRYNVTHECCTRDNHPCGTNTVLSRRIFGGRPAMVDQWPWMIRMEILHEGESGVCSAVLISLEYAVTAGHCIEPFEISEITAFAAFRSIAQRLVAIESVVVHPQYSFPQNDIALVKFRQPIVVDDFVRPLCLPRGEEVADDKKCFIAGWGATDRTSGAPTIVLQEGRIRILPFRVCEEAYRNDPLGQNLAMNLQLCAGTLSGLVDSCPGDSGGPLMCQRCSSCSWYMAGTVSIGPQMCGTPEMPGIYTRMTAYEPWIEGIVGRTQRQTFTCN